MNSFFEEPNFILSEIYSVSEEKIFRDIKKVFDAGFPERKIYGIKEMREFLRKGNRIFVLTDIYAPDNGHPRIIGVAMLSFYDYLVFEKICIGEIFVDKAHKGLKLEERLFMRMVELLKESDINYFCVAHYRPSKKILREVNLINKNIKYRFLTF